MPITELALLTLPLSSTTNSPTAIPAPTIAALKHAAQAQATFSKHPVTLIHCIHDPSLIYLLGGWDSVAAHMDRWIPSSRNRELLRELKDEGVGVRWMVHVDVDPGLVGGLMRGSGSVVGVWRAEFEGLGDEGWRARVGNALGVAEAGKGGGDGIDSGGGELAVGWRMDDWFAATGYQDVSGWNTGGVGRDFNEVVVFSVWSSVENGLRFMEGELLDGDARIDKVVKWTEGRCGRVLCVAEP